MNYYSLVTVKKVAFKISLPILKLELKESKVK